MDFRALRSNYSKARGFCRAPLDRLKYLWWLYAKSLPLHVKCVTIRFVMSAPIGHFRLTVRPRTAADYFIFSEVFDRQYYALPLPRPPETILDLGANVGMTAVYFSRVYPNAKIACVEPMPENVVLLKANVADNAVNAGIYEAAASVVDGSLKMQRAALEYGSKPEGIPFGAVLTGCTVEVQGISIPSLIRRLCWQRISLAKIDIEGYEGVLLQQNEEWLERVDNICIELHEGFSEQQLHSVAAKWGFDPPLRIPGMWFLTRQG